MIIVLIKPVKIESDRDTLQCKVASKLNPEYCFPLNVQNTFILQILISSWWVFLMAQLCDEHVNGTYIFKGFDGMSIGGLKQKQIDVQQIITDIWWY